MRMDMFAAYDKSKTGMENRRGLSLAVVNIMTVQVTNLRL
jgi:hypothetical protein